MEMDILAAVVTIASFVLAVYIFVRSRIAAAREEGKIAVLRERLNNMRQSLTAIYYSVDAVVQIPKREETTIEELQNIARVTRGQILVLLKRIKRESEEMRDWRFGKMINSVAHGKNQVEATRMAFENEIASDSDDGHVRSTEEEVDS